MSASSRLPQRPSLLCAIIKTALLISFIGAYDATAAYSHAHCASVEHVMRRPKVDVVNGYTLVTGNGIGSNMKSVVNLGVWRVPDRWDGGGGNELAGVGVSSLTVSRTLAGDKNLEGKTVYVLTINHCEDCDLRVAKPTPSAHWPHFEKSKDNNDSAVNSGGEALGGESGEPLTPPYPVYFIHPITETGFSARLAPKLQKYLKNNFDLRFGFSLDGCGIWSIKNDEESTWLLNHIKEVKPSDQ